jgi:hypothetical protein
MPCPPFQRRNRIHLSVHLYILDIPGHIKTVPDSLVQEKQGFSPSAGRIRTTSSRCSIPPGHHVTTGRNRAGGRVTRVDGAGHPGPRAMNAGAGRRACGRAGRFLPRSTRSSRAPFPPPQPTGARSPCPCRSRSTTIRRMLRPGLPRSAWRSPAAAARGCCTGWPEIEPHDRARASMAASARPGAGKVRAAGDTQRRGGKGGPPSADDEAPRRQHLRQADGHVVPVDRRPALDRGRLARPCPRPRCPRPVGPGGGGDVRSGWRR